MQATEQIPAITDLQPFDICVVVGRLSDARVRENLTQTNILQVLDLYGIAEALITSNFARLHSPHRRGNLWTVEFCRISPRLHPVWVLEPSAKPGRAVARADIDEMQQAGVKVARLLMGTGASAPLLWWWKDLLEELQARRIPCLVDFGSCNYSGGGTNSVPNDAEINQLREIVLAFPDLQFILSHASGGLGIAKSALPLMYRCANLHIDITGVVDYWRRAARDIGPERVFFATGMPYYDGGILTSNVQYEPGLSLAARKMIYGGNIRCLMEAVR